MWVVRFRPRVSQDARPDQRHFLNEVDCRSQRLLTLIAPLVLLAHLLLLFGGEVVLDIEGNTDLFGGLSLEHVGDSFAGEVEQVSDFQEVGSLEEKMVG